jgi:hypothetical protein
MEIMKLIAFKNRFTHVGKCDCGKTWNAPGDEMWEATAEDVRAWAEERGYRLIVDEEYDQPPP